MHSNALRVAELTNWSILSQIATGFATMDLADFSHHRRWWIVGLLFAASLINYLDRAAISFALPFISRDFHLTAQGKGLLLSSFFWSYALMQLPIGWSADRFNLRWLYAGGFSLGSENPFTCQVERKSSACCLRRENVVCPQDSSTSGLEPDWCSKASWFLGS